jgi:hypothetical protein
MRATISLILAALLVPAAACGGSGSGAPTITSGVDQSVAISDMSQAQDIALCEAAQEAGRLSAEMFASSGPCMTVGIMTLAFGGDASDCQAAVDECEASDSSDGDMARSTEPTEEVIEESTCDGSFGDTIGSECTATVGDYEACGNATLALQQEVADSMGCSMDMSSGDADMTEEATMPAECTTLEAMGCTLGMDQSDSDSDDSLDF